MNYLPLLIIGGYLAYKYLPTGIALINLSYSFISFGLDKIEADSLTAHLILQVKNNSGKSILFQNITSKLSLNGIHIGDIEDNYLAPIGAKSSQLIRVNFTINKSNIGDEIWNMIINQQTDFNFNMSGTVKANDTVFPFSATWTMNDLVNPTNARTEVSGIGKRIETYYGHTNIPEVDHTLRKPNKDEFYKLVVTPTSLRQSFSGRSKKELLEQLFESKLSPESIEWFIIDSDFNNVKTANK
ncbi:hypothetical protein TRIP_D300127 [uncultured Paludibacter sp.]|nr:hypothetical protein TRIP_D300127 [uncultured Paludibacter sp.]